MLLGTVLLWLTYNEGVQCFGEDIEIENLDKDASLTSKFSLSELSWLAALSI